MPGSKWAVSLFEMRRGQHLWTSGSLVDTIKSGRGSWPYDAAATCLGKVRTPRDGGSYVSHSTRTVLPPSNSGRFSVIQSVPAMGKETTWPVRTDIVTVPQHLRLSVATSMGPHDGCLRHDHAHPSASHGPTPNPPPAISTALAIVTPNAPTNSSTIGLTIAPSAVELSPPATVRRPWRVPGLRPRPLALDRRG
jgi:hypothetical protein